MAKQPVYRCRCGEVLFDTTDARTHLSNHDPGDHAYRAIVDCEHCETAIGEWATVHLGGVYCCGECARRAKQANETPSQQGDLSV